MLQKLAFQPGAGMGSEPPPRRGRDSDKGRSCCLLPSSVCVGRRLETGARAQHWAVVGRGVPPAGGMPCPREGSAEWSCWDAVHIRWDIVILNQYLCFRILRMQL